jgi:hypothetical protein
MLHVRRRWLHLRMDKKPTPPPQHRAYPRAHPVAVRPTAQRPGAARPASVYGWSRAVPEGRRFPRGG